MYFAESKAMTTVGSVSEDTELRTDAFQDMGTDEDRDKDCAEEERRERVRQDSIYKLRRHGQIAIARLNET